MSPEEVLTWVWWDIETCPLPDRYDAGVVGRSIKSVLKNAGCLGPIIITAIGNLNRVPHDILQKLSSNGVALKYVPCGIEDISSDIYRWECSHSPPANIVLISDNDLPNENSYNFMGVRRRGNTTFQACPFPPKFPARWLWPEDLLKDAASSGGSTNNEQHKLQKSCRVRGEYEFSCTLCCLDCHSFERLARHLQSKQHELFDISFNTDGEASQNAYYMALSASPYDSTPVLSPDRKLFVGNISLDVDTDDLSQLFESAGNVEIVDVVYNRMTGWSRGFGFVKMSTAAEVEAAAKKFNGYEFEGRRLIVKAAPPTPKRDESFSRTRRPRSAGYGSERGYGGSQRSSYDSGSRSGSGKCLYVSNLSWRVDDMALERLFNEEGKVVEARVIYDRDSGRSKGFGFVTLSSSREVQKAIKYLNGVDLHGRQIRVSEAEARPPRRQF